MEEKFSSAIYEKRIYDAVETGFIRETETGKYCPTEKAKIMTYLLKPLGKLTKSLDTYNQLKEAIENDGN